MRLKTACCVRNQSACSSDSRMRAARPGSQQRPARPSPARPRKDWGGPPTSLTWRPARPPPARSTRSRPRKGWGANARCRHREGVVDIARESLTPRGGYNARWCEQRASVPVTRVGASNARRRSLPLRGLRAAARGPSPPALLGVAHKGRNQATRHRTQGPESGNTASHTGAESSPCVRRVFRKPGSLCAQPRDWGPNPGA